MSGILEAIQELPPERGGLRRGERLVIGLSGGADSVALTGLLHALAPRLGVKLFAAHLDHGLRDESPADREFCRALCRRLGIPFGSARADVRGRAKRTGEGVEAAGRHLRRVWLEKVRRHYRADRIALAHHLDDHLETLLLWMGRGTGLSGLAGIRPVSGRVVRPLREFRRAELRAECERRGWEWREDPTNPGSARGALRKGVLPVLEEALGPGSLERMGGLSRRVVAEREALDWFATDFVARSLQRAEEGLLEFDRDAWRTAPQNVIFQALRVAIDRLGSRGAHQRWNEARYRDVLEFVRGGRTGQQMDLPGTGTLEFTRSSLLLKTRGFRPENTPPADFDLGERLLTRPPAEASFGGPDRAFLDADRVQFPLNLRMVRPGDRMQPFGMTGHRKVSRMLAERAVARHDRPRRLVVEDQERIVWAVGLTTSEHTRITEDTRRVLELRLRPRANDGKGPSL